jgi:hypothetical protein
VLSTDAERHLQIGLLTALMHVASLRLPSAGALAVELDAAERAVRKNLESFACNCVLRSAFARGISIEILRAIKREQLSGDRRLLALKRKELLEVLEITERSHYRALVQAAAEAVLQAEIEEQPQLFGRRVSNWERIALEDIARAFETSGWRSRESATA